MIWNLVTYLLSLSELPENHRRVVRLHQTESSLHSLEISPSAGIRKAFHTAERPNSACLHFLSVAQLNSKALEVRKISAL